VLSPDARRCLALLRSWPLLSEPLLSSSEEVERAAALAFDLEPFRRGGAVSAAALDEDSSPGRGFTRPRVDLAMR
jgi:hypothetical protein